MAEVSACPKCGKRLPDDAPAGICPECLLRAAFAASQGADNNLDDSSTPTLISTSNDDSPILPPTNRLDPGNLPSTAIHKKLRYFGDYELIQEIARGGMGVVYKARQVNLNWQVALKMILAGQLAGPDLIQRFYTEAEAAAQLDHPGIVPIFEVGQYNGQHFFSMAFVEGQSLATRVAEGPLPPREAAQLVHDVALAVQYAHDKGVIHRDLKPGNILVDQQGNPRVTDFGLAKLEKSGSDLTGTGQILGTPSYMPPEQASGKTDLIGPPADIYSLGAILYCLLTGRPPFQAASPMDTLLQVLDQEPVSVQQLNAQVPLDLDTIALKCLDKMITRRYDSALQLADELKRFLDGRPILARPVGRIERGWRWCKRQPIIAGLSVSLLVALLAGTIISAYFAINEREQKLEANKQTGIAKLALGAEKEQRNIAVEAQKHEAEQAELARQSARELYRTAYIADMNRLAEVSQAPNIERRRATLQRYIPEGPNDEDLRGFEWYYWWREAHQERRTFDFKEAIQKVATSLNGQWLAVACRGGALSVWNLGTNEKLPTTFVMKEANWAAVSFTPDGMSLMAISTQGSFKKWALPTGELLEELAPVDPADTNRDGMLSFVRSAAAISPNGRRMIAPLRPTGLLAEWQVAEMKPSLLPQLVDGMFIGPDGNGALLGETREIHELSRPAEINPWEIRKWQMGKRDTPAPETWGSPVFCLTFSSDENFFAAGDRDGRVRVFKPALHGMQQLQHTFSTHDSIVWSLAFSADGRFLAAGGDDGRIVIWDAQAHQLLYNGIPHIGSVLSLVFHKDIAGTNRLISGGKDGTIRICEVPSGRPQRTLLGHIGPVASLAVVDGHNLVSGGADGTIKFWDLDEPPRVLRSASPAFLLTGAFNSRILATRDGSRVVASNRSGKNFFVWDSLSGKYIGSISIPASAGRLDLTDDGRMLSVHVNTGNVIFWDLQTLKTQSRDRTSNKFINSNSRLSPNGDLRANWNSRRGPLLVTEAATGTVRLEWKLLENQSDLEASQFSPNSAWLATTTIKTRGRESPPELRTWDLISGAEPAVLQNVSIRNLAFSADGLQLAVSAYWDTTPGRTPRIRLLETRTLKVIAEIPDTFTNHATNVLDISPDGRLLAFNTNNALLIWDIHEQRIERKIEGLSATDLRFTDEGQTLLVICGYQEDDRVRRFQVATGTELSPLTIPPVANLTLAISHDGSRLVTAAQYDSKATKEGGISGVAMFQIMDPILYTCFNTVTGVETKFRADLPLLESLPGRPNRVVAPPGGSSTGRNSNDFLPPPGVREVRTERIFPDGSFLTKRTFTPAQATRTEEIFAILEYARVPFLQFTPDGQTLITDRGALGVGESLRTRWPPSNVIRQLDVYTQTPPAQLALSPDGRKLAIIADSGVGEIWQMSEIGAGSWVRQLEGSARQVSAAAFAPDTEKLAAATNDGVLVWQHLDAPPATLRGHSSQVTCVRWSPKGDMIASASDDRTVRLWDVATMTTKYVLKEHSGGVNAVLFTPDGRTLISAGEEGQLILWDTTNGEYKGRLPGKSGSINQLAISADGRLLGAAADSGELLLWRAALAAEITAPNIIHVPGDRSEEHLSQQPLDGMWPPDGLYMASDGAASLIRIWSLAKQSAQTKP